MFAQAAGTGASAGAAAVSESDMSVVVLLCGVEGSCPVQFLSSERLNAQPELWNQSPGEGPVSVPV